MEGEDRTGRERKERLRARRDEAGMAQVSGWVPKDRRAYARDVLAALARGANSLPSDPEQAAALDAAQADAAEARTVKMEVLAALSKAEQREKKLATELDAGSRAEAAALARAEAAERGREETAHELAAARAEAEALQGREQAAQEAADALRGELAGIRGRGGWRGVLLRLAGA